MMIAENTFAAIPLWGRGFRPFFLLAAVLACLLVAYWAGFMADLLPAPAGMDDPVLWHAHEMIYGFTMAVVAGFLLTAVANWTSWAPVRGRHLALLCGLWLAGRLGFLLPGLPEGLRVALDLLFIPALTISLYVPLHKTRNVRNYVFVALLGGLFAFDVLFLLSQDMGWLHAALFLILAMVSIIGGRIIPAFTVAALRQRGLVLQARPQPLLDALCLGSMVLLALGHMLFHHAVYLTAVLAAAAGLLHLWRGRCFHTRHTAADPLLWILHAGYYWLIAGLFLLAAGLVGWVELSPAWHALTVGAVGSLTLGMMSRVALGHTGRPLLCHRLTVLSFWLMQLVAVLRVAGPVLMPQHYPLWISLSAGLWVACFTAYLAVYVPVLLQPRPDGLPA